MLLLACAAPAAARAQISAADSAAVLLDAARELEADGEANAAYALYRLIVERYAATTAAASARARLDARPLAEMADGDGAGDGATELTVWMTTYGAWLGVAVPGALGADGPEPYGVGLLLGAPAGFFGGRALARGLGLGAGQARAITLGGTWGTWQGFGWREVLDWGVPVQCNDDPFGPELCFETEDATEERFAAMVIGGLAGVTAGALLSDRTISPGAGTLVNSGALWGSWLGFALGVLTGLNGDDDRLAATLVGGDVGLLSTALLAPSWRPSRSRVRLVSVAGLLGGLAGGGLDLIVQPDDEKVAVAIPLAGSIAGLVIGALTTRERTGTPDVGGGRPEAEPGALFELRRGRLELGLPVPMPAARPAPGRAGWSTGVAVELLRARL